MHAWSARRLCAFREQPSLCALVNVYVCLYATFACVCACLFYLCVCVCVGVQVTLKLPHQMCRSLDCVEWWVAPSLTLQTCNKAHRSLQLMSSRYREHAARASSLPTVSIKASISGEQSFLCSCWHRTKELDTKCKSASSTWGGSSLLVSHSGVTGPSEQAVECRGNFLKTQIGLFYKSLSIGARPIYRLANNN